MGRMERKGNVILFLAQRESTDCIQSWQRVWVLALPYILWTLGTSQYSESEVLLISQDGCENQMRLWIWKSFRSIKQCRRPHSSVHKYESATWPPSQELAWGAKSFRQRSRDKHTNRLLLLRFFSPTGNRILFSSCHGEFMQKNHRLESSLASTDWGHLFNKGDYDCNLGIQFPS